MEKIAQIVRKASNLGHKFDAFLKIWAIFFFNYLYLGVCVFSRFYCIYISFHYPNTFNRKYIKVLQQHLKCLTMTVLSCPPPINVMLNIKHYTPVSMPLCARTGPMLAASAQNRPSSGMFIWLTWLSTAIHSPADCRGVMFVCKYK